MDEDEIVERGSRKTCWAFQLRHSLQFLLAFLRYQYLSVMTATRYSYVSLNEASTHFSNNVAGRGKETEKEKASRLFFKLQRCKLVRGEHTRQSAKAPSFSVVSTNSRCSLLACMCFFARSLILLPALRVYADAAPRTIEDLSMVNCFLREILPCLLH